MPKGYPPHIPIPPKTARNLKTDRGGLLLGFGLVFVANIGAWWFGKSFKLVVVILVASVFIVTWLLIRYHKTQLVHKLTESDKETQDAVLANLEEADRKEILKKLGRDDS